MDQSDRRFPSRLTITSSISKWILVCLTLRLLLSIHILNEESRSELVQPATIYYGKDDGGCNAIQTKYKLHKLVKDNGHKLSAKQRAELVKERCQTFMKENNMQFRPSAKCKLDGNSFVISRRYDLSICYNYKVASTNTKRVFYGLDHNFSLLDNINNLSIPVISKYTKQRNINFHRLLSEKQRINFMVVREPLERLLSAYLDKRVFPRNYYKDPSFSFERFLKGILDIRMTHIEIHINPYLDRCRPCEIQYDYIGLQSEFIDDIKILLHELNASDKIAIPSRNKTGYNTDITREILLKQYFEKVPNELIHNLWAKYYKDYYIFGFPYPSHLMY